VISLRDILLRTIRSWKISNPNLLTFEDLVFEDHFLLKELKNMDDNETKRLFLKEYEDCKQAKIKFDNEEYISVCIGSKFYSNRVDTYELYTSRMSEPAGYINKDEVSFEMILFQLDKPKFLITEKTSIPNIQLSIEEHEKR
jgi:hypothetical protein